MPQIQKKNMVSKYSGIGNYHVKRESVKIEI